MEPAREQNRRPRAPWRDLAARRLRERAAQIAATSFTLAVFIIVACGGIDVQLRVQPGAANLAAVAATPEFVLLVSIGLALSLLLPMMSPLAGSALTFASMLPVYWLGYESPVRPLIPMEFQLLTILMVYSVHALAGYFREVAQKQKVISIFGRYVPPALALRLGREPGAVDLEGEARELTILFCDVHGFTALSERLEPRRLTRLLNAMFTPLTEVVHRHGGTIDKYIGDAMMAFWGAPLPDPHHAGNAVAAAFEMQQAMARLGHDFETRGWPALALGIGINTGVVHVGNMGSRYRMTYTAIGDAVNLAARLQDLTRVFHAPIIVGESTRRAFPGAVYRELGLVQVKGKQELVRIYEPCLPELDPNSTIAVNLRRHNAALERYYVRDWDAAEQAFTALATGNPDDPLYAYYLERIGEFRDRAPPPDWRGEIRFTVK